MVIIAPQISIDEADDGTLMLMIIITPLNNDGHDDDDTKQVVEGLRRRRIIGDSDVQLVKPCQAPKDLLLDVHVSSYLEKLKSSSWKVAEVRWQHYLGSRLTLSDLISVLAACLGFLCLCGVPGAVDVTALSGSSPCKKTSCWNGGVVLPRYCLAAAVVLS